MLLDDLLRIQASDEVYRNKGVMHLKTAVLKDLPANIVQPNRHLFSIYCFLRFNSSYKTDIVQWLKQLPLTSAHDLLLHPKENSVSLMLGYSGYVFFCDPQRIEKLIPLQDDNILAFKRGLRERCPEAFGSTKSADIEPNYAQSIDALILISTNDQEMRSINEESDQKMKSLKLYEFFIDCTKSPKGPAFHTYFGDTFFEIGLRNPDGSDGKAREWFGFRDGISNPRFFNSSDSAGRYYSEQPSKLGVVLRRNRLSPKPYACGSFVAFLKLEQHIEAFDKYTAELAQRLGIPGSKDLAAAYMVGRHKDGKPLHRNYASLHSSNTLVNDFDYARDDQGKICPLHAHARKANPRIPSSNHNRIVRRGSIFGTRLAERKGLLFLSYQSNLSQFEDIVNRSLYAYNFAGKNIGRDPLFLEANAYQASHSYKDATCSMRSPYLTPQQQFITFRGGQYFYASSISFIQINLEKCMEQ